MTDSRASESPLRVGMWSPTQGPLIAFSDESEDATASARYNLDTIVLGDQLGYDATLIAQQTMNIRDPQLPIAEPWTLASAAAVLTQRIELIVAVKPLLYQAGIAAKLALGLAEISAGRGAVNVVSGWFLPELAALGMDSIDHAERYAVTEEWLMVVDRLLSGAPVNFRGRYVQARELMLRPSAQEVGRPMVYMSGDSDDARQIAARHADAFLMHPRSPEAVASTVRDVRNRAERNMRTVEFGLSTRIVARATRTEAWDAAHQLAERESRNSTARIRSGTDSSTRAGKPSNAFAAAENGSYLVGSYTEVADALRRLNETGITLALVQFQPVREEMHRVAENVLPLIRR